ncbi:MAG TPA: hypothetical protein VF573_16545, partial [Paraburkholderia sp.]|uniref:hypothetical protein n=1 Tax=Paraburkholderia sp. TaxID=1926495 RepID=UPI002ED51626
MKCCSEVLPASAFPRAIKKAIPLESPRLLTKPWLSPGLCSLIGVMFKKPTPAQQELEMVTLEMLVPKD